MGLRANLAANWSLLTATGLSTNAVSKAAHDIMRRRDASPGARRFAASGGYVLTEAAKEVPYYAGAFGASVLANAVTTADALDLPGRHQPRRGHLRIRRRARDPRVPLRPPATGLA